MQRITILGCGSSAGVPRLGNDWGHCDPNNPKNRRRRCSILVEQIGTGGITRVLVDTGPDMREQLLDAHIGVLDGVVYTHSHADHLHGIDDLRQIVFNIHKRLPVWADEPTQAALLERFGYAFIQPEGSLYPPILDMQLIDGPFTINGAGGDITFTPFVAGHGNINALGFRVGDMAYLPDANMIPDDSWPLLQNLSCWVVDALRRKPHPTHAHLAQTLEWIERAQPKQAVLTNLHHDMDYETLCRELPSYIRPAFDGMKIAASSG